MGPPSPLARLRKTRLQNTALAQQQLTLPYKEWCGKYAVHSREFTAGIVGAKSLNIAELQVQ